MALPEISAWSVQQLRITAFPLSNGRAKEEAWWAQLFGDPAETRTTKPKESLFQDEGEFADGRLSLAVRPGRVDWVWAAGLSQVLHAAPVALPSLGSFPSSCDALFPKIEQWFEIAPPLSRLALGVVLDQQVPDKEAGYRLLQAYLPAVKLDASGTTDFLFQINRPTKSSVLPGYTINRLSRWVALRVNMMGARDDGASLTREFHLIRLELDINSFIEAGVPIPKTKDTALLQELAAAAMAIASNGDAP